MAIKLGSAYFVTDPDHMEVVLDNLLIGSPRL
jgi:hypothetical protein